MSVDRLPRKQHGASLHALPTASTNATAHVAYSPLNLDANVLDSGPRNTTNPDEAASYKVAASRVLGARLEAPRVRLAASERVCTKRLDALEACCAQLAREKDAFETGMYALIDEHMGAALAQLRAHAAHVVGLRARAKTQLQAIQRVEDPSSSMATGGSSSSRTTGSSDDEKARPAMDRIETLEEIGL